MKKCVVILILTFALIFQGCASKDSGEEKTSTNSVQEDTTLSDTSEKLDEVVTATPSPEPLVLPTLGNDTGKVLIQTVSANRAYPYTTYIITSTNGESVVIDPTMMPDLSIIDINPAAIMCTHAHPDHTDKVFTGSYEVPKLLFEEGEIQTKDFHIYSIKSSHMNDTISTTNVIMVLEVDGLRIAHMGDIGQTALTDEQLKALGDIDIAFMQFENSYSDMSLENEKGFKLIEQLNPKIVIPTHYSDDAEPILEQKYGAITEFDNILQISKEDIPEKSLSVYEILNNHKYK